MSELEKVHQLQYVLLQCYAAAIGDMAQYAIEIDDEVTPAYRRHLREIGANVGGDIAPAQVVESRSMIRNELRDYRDRAAVFLNGLRRDLQAKAEALEAIVSAMATADGDHEQRLRSALAKLRKLADAPAVPPPRAELLAAADQIQSAIEEVRRQNQLNLGQFMAEVKTLHRRIATLEAASGKDVLTGLASRIELEAHIAAEVDQGKKFALVALRIANLPVVQRQFGARIRADVLAAFAKRMGAALPADALAGRWGEDRFMALVAAGNAEAMALGKALAQHLSGTYVCMEDGRPRQPALVVSALVIPGESGCTYEALIERINAAL